MRVHSLLALLLRSTGSLLALTYSIMFQTLITCSPGLEACALLAVTDWQTRHILCSESLLDPRPVANENTSYGIKFSASELRWAQGRRPA